jgi:hypothetical protein
MILKASQRASGQNLAIHLMKVDDNEHVQLHELRGFASDNLKDAFKEAEAISLGTKCKQYLFSLSLSPPEGAKVSVADFERAIGTIEERLHLNNQPRAIVFHEKEGRRHAHCVWSRIDAQTMTARQMSFFKTKLMNVSRDLYLEHGWQMPRGIANGLERDPLNFTLQEWQQAKRAGSDPRWLRQAVQDCWNRSDNARAFTSALNDKGFFLARGDKRSIVLLDHAGDVHSLPRVLDLKTKDVRARLGSGDELASVAQTKAAISARMTPAIRRHVQDARGEFTKKSARLGTYKQEMTLIHRDARANLAGRQALEWDAETRTRAMRIPTGLRGLWHRITGRYQEVRRDNEREANLTIARHAHERQQLIDKQLEQRAVLQGEFRKLRKAQAERLADLRHDIGRYLRLSRGPDDAALKRQEGLGLRLQR